MKLKLTQAGYTGYTGLLGNLHFTNGVSDQSVSAETAAGIANIFQCDRIDGVTDNGKFDPTSATTSVNDTTGDVNFNTIAAPVDSDNRPFAPVQPAEGTPEPDPI